MSLYTLNVPAGAVGAFHDTLSPAFTDFLPQIPLYFSFDYSAARTTGAGICTLRVELRWYDVNGVALTPFTQDIIINATIADTLVRYTVIPPAGAKSGRCYIKVTPAASPMQHDVWIKKLRLGKNALTADNTAEMAALGDGNRARWTLFEAGVKGWSVPEVAAGVTTLFSALTVNGKPAVQMSANFTGAGQFASLGTDTGVNGARMPVTAGERIFVGAQVASDSGIGVNGLFQLQVGWLDSTGAEIGARSTLPQLVGGIAPFTRVAGFMTVPAGAVNCFFRYVINTNTGTGARTGVLTIAEPMLCSAGPSQTTFPAFSPGPGAEPGSTLGAAWGANVSGRPANLSALTGTEFINNALVPMGTNVICNSSFSHVGDLVYGWSPSWDGNTGLPLGRGVNLDTPWFGQTNVAFGSITGTPAAGTVWEIWRSIPGTEPTWMDNLKRGAVSVVPGETLFASALVATHRCRAEVWIYFLDGAGNGINGSPSIQGGREGGGANGDPNNFDRLGVFATAPANARYAYFFMRGVANGIEANPYVFFTQCMLCKVPAGQTVWPPYTEGPADRSATLGATWSSNVAGRPGNLAGLTGGEGILNSGVSVGANGTLFGAGGGQVTFPGITNGLAVDAAARQGTNYFPYPRGGLDGRTPSQLGWGNAEANGGFSSIVNGTADWTGGGFYQCSRPSGGSAVNLFPYYDMGWSSIGVDFSLSVYGYCGGSGSFSPYVEFWAGTPGASTNTGSAVCTLNTATNRYEVHTTVPSGTTIARIVMRAVYPASGTYQDLTFWGIKVESTSAPTPYVDPPEWLSRPGGYRRLGDGRNIPAVFGAGGRYYFNQSPTYSAATTSATISIAAGTLQLGGTPISYSAMSVGVTGTAGTSATYNLYIEDFSYAGGSKSLVATTSAFTPYENDARIYLGQVTVTFPASGTTGGSGGGAGGGGYGCVWEDAWVETQRGLIMAKDVVEGDMVRVLDTETMEGTRWERVTRNYVVPRAGWEIRTEEGDAVLHLSCETPLTLKDNSCIWPCQLEGQELPVLVNGEFRWARCYAQPLGRDIPVAHISCAGQVYAAGNERDKLILTHNFANKP
jgi:hypothetical protein